MIFDKNGKKTFQTSGYPGNEKILEELAKVWETWKSQRREPFR